MADFPPNCVAFITGAGSGIGLAVAHRLAADGIKKIAIIDVTSSPLEDAVSSLSKSNAEVEVLSVVADCSKEEDVERAVAETVEKFGKLDVCFNAAGISGETAKIADMSVDNLDRVLGINLRGVWLCERAQIRQMLKQDLRDLATGLPFKTRGSIVNVGSLSSHIGLNAINPYVMAKHGVLGLVKADTIDYAADGIRTNCICPGYIKTAMTKMLWDSAYVTRYSERAPMNRWGVPEEIAYTTAFLLCDRSSFIAGTSIDIDGGYLAQ